MRTFTPLLIAATLASPTVAAAQPSQTMPTAPPPAPVDPYGYPPPQPYMVPAPVAEPSSMRDSGTVEITADFAALGVLSSITVLDVNDWSEPETGTLLVMAGALGGGAAGWILADRTGASRADGHATTLGLALGMANAGLLLFPTGQDDGSEEVLPMLTLGGTVGALGGLALGKKLELTEGQTAFATNVTLLGVGTSAMVAALVEQREEQDSAEVATTLLIGLDAGALAGLIAAPRIQWSRGRARFVGAMTLVGTFLGGMIGASVATEEDGATGDSQTNADLAVASMLVGMWGGFAGGVAISSDWSPDPRFRRAPRAAAAAAPSAITAVPMVGDGRLGVMASGAF